MKIVAFVPIKFHSERLKNKNFLKINDKSLCYYIFDTLLKINLINEIYVFCRDKKILEYIPKNIKFLEREKHLDNNDTLGMEIYQSFIDKIDSDIYLLCHTTSPFIKELSIIKGLEKILNEDYDSACSCKLLKTFAWFKNKPLNYNLDLIPRTQNIEPVIIETSAFYAFKKEVIKNKKRIGEKHFFVNTTDIESIDIDTENDFNFAKTIFKSISN